MSHRNKWRRSGWPRRLTSTTAPTKKADGPVPQLMAVICSAALLASCAGYPETSYVVENNTLLVNGVIDGSTPITLKEALDANPTVDTLILESIPGSADDEAALLTLSELIRGRNLTTRIPNYGMVASGGTDMFLMGATRIIEPGACIGVHTWGGTGLFGGTFSGASADKDDPLHDMYLTFYDRMGIPAEFYWFTLDAAGIDDIHWMDADELNRYLVPTSTFAPEKTVNSDDRNAWCEYRLLVGSEPLPASLSVAEGLKYQAWNGRVFAVLVENEDYRRLPIDTPEQAAAFDDLALRIFTGDLAQDAFVRELGAAYPGHEVSIAYLADLMFSNL